MSDVSCESVPGGDLSATPMSGPDRLDGLDGAGFDALAVLSRALHLREPGLDDTLQAVLKAATTLLPGARDAGLNLFVGGKFTPRATVGSAPPALDVLQQRMNEGPCLESSRDQVTVTVEDMSTDERWPEFAAEATAEGIHSMLCLPLWVSDAELGSLSLYGASPGRFSEFDRRLAELYATHAALALAAARRTEQFRHALASRDLIGQAKGIMMERYRLTADQAFDVLKRQSQHINRKVLDVARSVASTGELPAK